MHIRKEQLEDIHGVSLKGRILEASFFFSIHTHDIHDGNDKITPTVHFEAISSLLSIHHHDTSPRDCVSYQVSGFCPRQLIVVFSP